MNMTDRGERDDNETFYNLDDINIETMMDETERSQEELLGVINESSLVRREGHWQSRKDKELKGESRRTGTHTRHYL